MNKVWIPKWLERLSIQEDFSEDTEKPSGVNYDMVERVIHETMKTSDKKEIIAAKTRLTQVIQHTIDSALVLQGTILDSQEHAISTWTGSAFLIQPNVAITNAHTVLGADLERGERSLVIVSLDGEQFYKIRVIAANTDIDVGVIELLDFPGHRYLKLGDSDLTEVGEMTIVLGAPEGWQNSANIGYLTNKNQTLDIGDLSWRNIDFIDAYISSGSSGAAVVDMDGNVVGIVIGIIGEHSKLGVGINAVIPINKAKKFLTENNILFEE